MKTTSLLPGKPGTATPEHLFAAGYAACFGGALDFVGKQHRKDASKARITCAVSIGPRDGGGFGLAVKRRVEDKSLQQDELVVPSPSHPVQLTFRARNEAVNGDLHLQFELSHDFFPS